MNCHARSTWAGKDATILCSHAPYSANRPQVSCVLLFLHAGHHPVYCPAPALDANPPVRLSCGHAISRDAMKKLVSHSRRYRLLTYNA